MQANLSASSVKRYIFANVKKNNFISCNLITFLPKYIINLNFNLVFYIFKKISIQCYDYSMCNVSKYEYLKS